MRPIVGGQVSRSSRAGRVRYSCLKEAAPVGWHLCKLNGVGVMRKDSRRSSGAKKRAGRISLVVVCVGSGREFEARVETGSWFGGKKGAPRRQVGRAPSEGDGNCRIMRRLRRERVENGVGSGQP